jgi:TRAP-type C4-dicarboxylate transport system substrate-binding protein
MESFSGDDTESETSQAPTGRVVREEIMRNAIARLFTILTVAALAGFGAGTARAADFTMKIGFVTINDQNQQWANWYKEAVEKGSNGRIEVQIFPASQLGPVPRQIEGVQLGTIEAVLLPADFFVGLDPRYGVFSIPGLFKDMKNAAAAIADPALNKEILDLGESKGMVGITAFVYSAADYFGKDPIRKLDDFKGKKFRINATPAERERMRVLGATAVPLPTNEVVPALQRGAIDGTQSAIALFVNFKYIDLGKVLTQTDDTMLVPIAVVSKAWLDKLPPDLQKLVVEEGRKLQSRVQARSFEVVDDMRKKWIAAGGELVTLPAADQARLGELLKGVGPEVTKANPALNTFYKRVQSVAEKH